MCTVDFGDAASTKRYDNMCCIDAATAAKTSLGIHEKCTHAIAAECSP